MSHTVELLLDHVELPNDEMAITAGAKIALSDEDYGKLSPMDFGRAVEDGKVTAGRGVVESASAAFTVSDLGKMITVAGFPRGTRILRIVSGTQVEVGRIIRTPQMENQAEVYSAPASATGQRVVIGVVADA